MITLDTNPETDKKLKDLILLAIDNKGFQKTYEILNGMFRCAVRRNHAIHTEFAKQSLKYYEQVLEENHRKRFC